MNGIASEPNSRSDISQPESSPVNFVLVDAGETMDWDSATLASGVSAISKSYGFASLDVILVTTVLKDSPTWKCAKSYWTPLMLEAASRNKL